MSGDMAYINPNPAMSGDMAYILSFLFNPAMSGDMAHITYDQFQAKVWSWMNKNRRYQFKKLASPCRFGSMKLDYFFSTNLICLASVT